MWPSASRSSSSANAAAAGARRASSGVNAFDRGVVDGAVNGLGRTTGFFGGALRYLQSGNVQRYAAFLFTGVIIAAIIVTRV